MITDPIYLSNEYICTQESQRAVRMIVVDLWLTDLDGPYRFHRKFDSIP